MRLNVASGAINLVNWGASRPFQANGKGKKQLTKMIHSFNSLKSYFLLLHYGNV